MCVSKNSQGINFSRPHAGVKNKLSVKLIRLSEASSCHPTPLEIWGILQVAVLMTSLILQIF